jgi:hypothetical protein
MTTHADRVARGRAARRKGHQGERDLAGYLRRWWPDAERKPDSGWRNSARESADHGDIRGTPLIVWEVKHCRDFRLSEFMRQTAEQATAASADYGVLVERRDRVGDPGRWWAWLTVADLLLMGGLDLVPRDVDPATLAAPVRTELRHVVALLVAAGYAAPGSATESPVCPRPAPTTLGSAESG